MFQKGYTKTYSADTHAFSNAQIGYAPLVGSASIPDAALRYLGLTWREVEPQEGIFAWDTIEEHYNLHNLRKLGIHLVLRFLCDLPSGEAHLDIPSWLYQKTNDGVWYDTVYGKGYSPNYANPLFLAAHHNAIAALAAHFDDGFVSYVELGSLGHWGEWHIKSDEISASFPEEATRDRYAEDYITAFTTAKLLMRRPFNIAARHRLGLYNDMTGHFDGTAEWLRWIEHGGWYDREPYALTAMPDFWINAPAGGEFSSSIPMKVLLGTKLSQTLTMIRGSHMSFLGPLTSDPTFQAGSDAVLKALGYRLQITQLHLMPSGKGTVITLIFANTGSTPFYWDWTANLYLEDCNGSVLQTIPLSLSLPSLHPGKKKSVTIQLEDTDFFRLLFQHIPQLTLGIVDPMTGRDAVRFATETEQRCGRAVLW